MNARRLFSERRLDALACLLAAAVFGLLTLRDLRLPGPHTDELFTAAPAVNFVEGTTGGPPMQIDPSVVQIAGRPFPLMVMTYVGSVQTALYVPVFFVFGEGLEVVRIVPIVMAILAIWCSYFFWAALYNRTVALLATVLLLADPGLVFFAGRDFGPPALSLLCKMGGLLLLLRWWRSGKRSHLFGGAFVWGIALYHKADFLWILVAAAIAALLFYRRAILTRLTAKDALAAAAIFTVGAAPFLLMNLLTAGATFRLLAQSAPPAEQIQAFVSALGVRAGQTVDMMTGAAPYRLFMGEDPAALPWFAFVPPVLVLGGIAALVVFAATTGGTDAGRKTWFLVTFLVLVFLQTAKTPTSLMPHHLMALYPFLQGAAAAGLVLLLERSRWRYRTGAVAAAALLAAAPCVAATQTVYTTLVRTGGAAYWSDAVYELTGFLGAAQRPVALMQWGFTSNLIVLSQGRLTLQRVYADLMKRGIDPDSITPYVHPSSLYLFYSGAEVEYRRTLEALTASAGRQGLRPEELRSFHQRDGREIYAVYHLRRLP